ncbi:uncharacterized protein RBU57_006906 isoform 1-T2 [Macrochelys suwanniensis]
MPRAPGFKSCDSCRRSMPRSDPHAECLRCRGETHVCDRCKICRSFKLWTKKERDIRLRALLMESALAPSPAPVCWAESAPCTVSLVRSEVPSTSQHCSPSKKQRKTSSSQWHREKERGEAGPTLGSPRPPPGPRPLTRVERSSPVLSARASPAIMMPSTPEALQASGCSSDVPGAAQPLIREPLAVPFGALFSQLGPTILSSRAIGLTAVQAARCPSMPHSDLRRHQDRRRRRSSSSAHSYHSRSWHRWHRRSSSDSGLDVACDARPDARRHRSTVAPDAGPGTGATRQQETVPRCRGPSPEGGTAAGTSLSPFVWHGPLGGDLSFGTQPPVSRSCGAAGAIAASQPPTASVAGDTVARTVVSMGPVAPVARPCSYALGSRSIPGSVSISLPPGRETTGT